jgi:hypothetical protein
MRMLPQTSACLLGRQHRSTNLRPLGDLKVAATFLLSESTSATARA